MYLQKESAGSKTSRKRRSKGSSGPPSLELVGASAPDGSLLRGGVTPDVPESDFGLCPPTRLVSIGVSEAPVLFMARVRKAAQMYLGLQLRLVNIEVLAAASDFLSKDYAAPGYDDLRAMVQGHYTLGVFLSAMKVCPLHTLVAPEEADQDPCDPSPSRQAQRRHIDALAKTLDVATVEPVLERAFTLWITYALYGGQTSINWTTGVVLPGRQAFEFAASSAFALPEAETLSMLLENLSGKVVMRQYAELYVRLLVNMKATDKLQQLLKRDAKTWFRPTEFCADARWTLELLSDALVEALRTQYAPLLKEVEGVEVKLPAELIKEPPPPPPPAPAPLPPQPQHDLAPQAQAPPQPSQPQGMALPLGQQQQQQQTGLPWAMSNAAVVSRANSVFAIAMQARQGQPMSPEESSALYRQCFLHAQREVLAQLGGQAALQPQMAAQAAMMSARPQIVQPALLPQLVPPAVAPAPAPTPAEPQPKAQTQPDPLQVAVMLTPEEIRLQDSVAEALESMQATLRGVPLGKGTNPGGRARTAAEDLQLDLLKAHAKLSRDTKVAGMDRKGALDECSKVVTRYKRQSRPPAAPAAPAPAPPPEPILAPTANATSKVEGSVRKRRRGAIEDEGNDGPGDPKQARGETTSGAKDGEANGVRSDNPSAEGLEPEGEVEGDEGQPLDMGDSRGEVDTVEVLGSAGDAAVGGTAADPKD